MLQRVDRIEEAFEREPAFSPEIGAIRCAMIIDRRRRLLRIDGNLEWCCNGGGIGHTRKLSKTRAAAGNWKSKNSNY